MADESKTGDRELSVLVIGASGFTGRFIVRRLLECSDELGLGLRVGAGGRNEGRVKAALEQVGVSWDRVIYAPVDALKAETVSAAVARARLVINCSGPFRRFGEPIVAACVSEGTHYIDISGEPEFIEKMEAVYHDAAVANGVLVVSACGFDSIPADLGTLYIQDQFHKAGAVASTVETYLQVDAPLPYCAHYTTWECAVLGFANVGQLKKLRRSRPRIIVPRRGPRVVQSSWPRREPKAGNRFALPFPGSDASIVRRSQKALVTAGDAARLQPVQFAAYFLIASRINLFLVMLAGLIFGILTRFGWGRSLLLKFPRLLSFGVFTHEGPTQEAMEVATFRFTVVGRGHRRAVGAGNKAAHDCELIARVTGPDPGYLGTARMTVAAALTMLLDLNTGTTEVAADDVTASGSGSGSSRPSRQHNRVGVLTTASAFDQTRIFERLGAAGIRFSVATPLHDL